jgi:hypothetical protein
MTTKAARRQPSPRWFGPPDLKMFAGLTSNQIIIVRALVTAGWHMTEAAHGRGEMWFETSELMHDMHLAWEKARRAEREAAA